MAARQRHEALARCAISSADPRQDRTLAPNLKNRILLENYFLPGDLEAQIEAFVDHYNHQRYHESINNVTPADVYFGRDKAILKKARKDQTKDTRNATLASPTARRIIKPTR